MATRRRPKVRRSCLTCRPGRAVGDDASFLAVDVGDNGAVIARLDSGRLVALRIVSPCDEQLLVRNVAWSISTVAGDQSRAVIGGRHAARLSADIAARVPGLRAESLPATPPVEGLGGREAATSTSTPCTWGSRVRSRPKPAAVA